MRRLLAVVVAVLALAARAEAAVAIDSTMTPAVRSTTSPLTFNFTNTAGTLLVCGSHVDGGTTIGTPTYNSVTMTAIGAGQTWQSSDKINLWYLKSPATGLNGYSITFTGTAAFGACISFTGNDTTTPVGSGFFAGNVSATPATVTVTGVLSTSIVVCAAGAGSSFTGGASGTTQRWILNNTGGSAGDNHIGGTNTGSGSVACAFNISQADFYGIAAVEVLAPAAGCAPNRTLLGLGCDD